MLQEETAFTSQQDADWVNRSRTLIVTSRGITPAQRRLILDVFGLLPHAKKEVKLEKEDVADQISELCELHKCRQFLYFETKKRVKFSLWVGSYPYGPSFKFWLEDTVGSLDMKLQGNSLKNSRHILSFDSHFETNPVWKVARELLSQAFNVPLYHPRSKSVLDHVLSFTVDPKSNSVWFKNYQIFREVLNKEQSKMELYEIGPRFVLEPACILQGVMKGEVLYRSRILKKMDKKHLPNERKPKVKKPKKNRPADLSEEEFSDQEE